MFSYLYYSIQLVKRDIKDAVYFSLIPFRCFTLSRRGKKTPCQRALLNTAETVMLRDESRTHCSLFLLLFMCLSLFCDVCDVRD